MKRVIVLLLLLATAMAVDYAWIGGDGAWENPANWSPNGVPQAADDTVTFNAGSIDAAQINAPTIIGLINIESGYTGTITLNAALTVTNVGGKAGTLTITDPAATFAINGQTLTTTGDIVDRGTITFADGSVVDGSTSAVWYEYTSPTWGTGTVTLQDITYALKAQTLTGGAGVTIEIDGVTIRADSPDGGGNAGRSFSVQSGDTLKLISDCYIDNVASGGYAFTTLGVSGTLTYENTPTLFLIGDDGDTFYGGGTFEFYNLDISGHTSSAVRMGHSAIATDFYIRNSFTTQSNAILHMDGADFFLGDTGAVGTFTTGGLTRPRYATTFPVTISAADPANPWVWTNTGTVDWDYTGGDFQFADGDIQFNIETGGGGVDLQLDDMIIDEIIVTSGDTLSFEPGTTTFTRIENRGTIIPSDGTIIDGGTTAEWYEYGGVDFNAGGGTVTLKDLTFAMKANIETGAGVTVELDGVDLRGDLDDVPDGLDQRIFTSTSGATVKFISDGSVTSNGDATYRVRTYIAGRGTWTYENTPTVTFQGGTATQRGLTWMYVGSDFHFYDVVVADHSAQPMYFGYLAGDGASFDNSLTINPGASVIFNDDQASSPVTLTFGTDSTAATLTNNGAISVTNDAAGAVVIIQGASADYPAVLTGNEINWDAGATGDRLELKWLDIRTGMITGGNGVDILLTGDVLMYNDLIVSASDTFTVGDYNMYMLGGGSVTEDGTITYGTGSIQASWTVDVNVKGNGVNLEGATVTFLDNEGGSTEYTTDANGDVSAYVGEFEYNADGTSTLTPYSITASKDGYASSAQNIPITSDNQRNFDLETDFGGSGITESVAATDVWVEFGSKYQLMSTDTTGSYTIEEITEAEALTLCADAPLPTGYRFDYVLDLTCPGGATNVYLESVDSTGHSWFHCELGAWVDRTDDGAASLPSCSAVIGGGATGGGTVYTAPAFGAVDMIMLFALSIIVAVGVLYRRK